MFGEVKNANLRNNKVSSSYHQFDPLSKKIINLTMQNIGIFQCSWGLCLRRILWPSSSDGISAQKATSIHKGTDIN
jgi:hypothetical protein